MERQRSRHEETRTIQGGTGKGPDTTPGAETRDFRDEQKRGEGELVRVCPRIFGELGEKCPGWAGRETLSPGGEWFVSAEGMLSCLQYIAPHDAHRSASVTGRVSRTCDRSAPDGGECTLAGLGTDCHWEGAALSCAGGTRLPPTRVGGGETGTKRAAARQQVRDTEAKHTMFMRGQVHNVSAAKMFTKCGRLKPLEGGPKFERSACAARGLRPLRLL